MSADSGAYTISIYYFIEKMAHLCGTHRTRRRDGETYDTTRERKLDLESHGVGELETW